MIEPVITSLGAGVAVSMILCGLYLSMRWPEKTQDVKRPATREEAKNRAIARELDARRKGGDE